MFSAASSQYSMSKSIHFPGRAEKDPRSVHEWWSSEGVGIEAGAGLCQEEDWLWSSGSANTESALGASSAARSLLTSQHRIVPWQLHHFLL